MVIENIHAHAHTLAPRSPSETMHMSAVCWELVAASKATIRTLRRSPAGTRCPRRFDKSSSSKWMTLPRAAQNCAEVYTVYLARSLPVSPSSLCFSSPSTPVPWCPASQVDACCEREQKNKRNPLKNEKSSVPPKYDKYTRSRRGKFEK